MHTVAELERDSALRLETTGLTLAEGKRILKHVQEVVVEEQVQACLVQHRLAGAAGWASCGLAFGQRIFDSATRGPQEGPALENCSIYPLPPLL
jgi:hypothetical protein